MTTQGFSLTASMMTCSSASTGSFSRASYSGRGEKHTSGNLTKHPFVWPTRSFLIWSVSLRHTHTHLYLWCSVHRNEDSRLWQHFVWDFVLIWTLFLLLSISLCFVLLFHHFLFDLLTGGDSVLRCFHLCRLIFIPLLIIIIIIRRGVQVTTFFCLFFLFFFILLLFPFSFSIGSADTADLQPRISLFYFIWRSGANTNILTPPSSHILMTIMSVSLSSYDALVDVLFSLVKFISRAQFGCGVQQLQFRLWKLHLSQFGQDVRSLERTDRWIFECLNLSTMLKSCNYHTQGRMQNITG